MPYFLGAAMVTCLGVVSKGVKVECKARLIGGGVRDQCPPSF